MKNKKGTFYPFGARITENGVQYTFVANATDDVYIAFYQNDKCVEKMLLPKTYRIGNVYSVEVLSTNAASYGYLYIVGEKTIVDPYATAVAGRDKYKDESRAKSDYFIAAKPTDMDRINFLTDSPSIEASDTVMYKLHMRGFTMRHGLEAKKRGNYLGVLAGLPYLQELGVTSIEIQPMYEFEEFGLKKIQHISPDGVISYTTEAVEQLNYWGYGPGNYFAPKSSYFGGSDVAATNCAYFIDEIHKAGMELILEMSFTQPYSKDYILDILHFWVQIYHVDGFHLLGATVPMEQIISDPWLASTKIFYDHVPLDAIGQTADPKHVYVYEDGFMLVCRQLQNHLGGSMLQFTNFMRRQNTAYGFVNYLANTTSFTMCDAYSYGEKHNEANGEENRDGSNFNESFNYGVEGPTRQKKTLEARRRAQRNALCMTFLSQAMPLLLSGDEIYNTCDGNNNPYCQDNSIGWVDFRMTKEKQKLFDFTKNLIAFRKSHTQLSKDIPVLLSDYAHVGIPDVSYHGAEPWVMQIGDEMKSVGILFAGAYADTPCENVLILFNFHYAPVNLALPQISKKGKWQLVLDTSDETTFTFEKRAVENQTSVSVPAETICIFTR